MLTETTKTTEQLALETEARTFITARDNRVGISTWDLEARIRDEVRAFENDRFFDPVAWLVAGLDGLAEDGDGLHTGLRGLGSKAPRTRSLLEAAFEDAVAHEKADLETFEGDEYKSKAEAQAEFEHQVAGSRAWLAQSAYAIWRRARSTEDYAADLARDEAVGALFSGDRVEIGQRVADRWAKVVDAWWKGWQAERPDVFGANVL
jgi:hypothetical protein